jgi:hypothetical protein
VVEAPEACDVGIAAGQPGACPAQCSDGNNCTADALLNGGTCGAVCSQTPIAQCKNGDGCCPTACNLTNDNDCSPSCGDGRVDAPETCDTAIPAGQPGACPTSCDDGNPCTADFIVGGGTCTASCASNATCKLVFVTNDTYDGGLLGFAGADTTCQGAASAAGLAGAGQSFRAWISASGHNGASAAGNHGLAFFRLDGVKVADNAADLTDGSLANPISVDEYGGPPGGGTIVWTGSDAGGGLMVDRGCGDWSSNSHGLLGEIGFLTLANSQWSNSGSLNCDSQFHLYCFEQ